MLKQGLYSYNAKMANDGSLFGFLTISQQSVRYLEEIHRLNIAKITVARRSSVNGIFSRNCDSRFDFR